MTVIYIDTSAFMRACLPDASDHAEALALLTRRPGALVSSELLWLEADRAAIRLATEDPSLATLPRQVTAALSHIDRVSLDRAVIAAARQIPQIVKSLDAIHVASAETLGDELSCVVTYDKTLTLVLQQRGHVVYTAAQANRAWT